MWYFCNLPAFSLGPGNLLKLPHRPDGLTESSHCSVYLLMQLSHFVGHQKLLQYLGDLSASKAVAAVALLVIITASYAGHHTDAPGVNAGN